MKPYPSDIVRWSKISSVTKRYILGPTCLIVALLAIWQLFSQGGFQLLSLQVLAWQRDFHRALTLAVSEFSGTPSPATWITLLGISFGYGVFHAAGPGHGKAVLATYLLSQGGARRRALVLSFVASLLQGLVAIGLIAVLVYGLGWLTRHTIGSVIWVEQASFMMVALLGVWLCLRALRLLRQYRPVYRSALAKQGSKPVISTGVDRSVSKCHNHCCGGHHHIDPELADNWRTALATVVAIGMRPCSGAVLLLGVATLLDNFLVGVTAVMMMSLGTALTVSTLALVSVFARDRVKRYLVRRSDIRQAGMLLGWVAFTGGLAIAVLGISLVITGANQPANTPLLGGPQKSPVFPAVDSSRITAPDSNRQPATLSAPRENTSGLSAKPGQALSS